MCFDGHRSDDFDTWVFKTTDYGVTWTDLGKALPARQPVHVLTADRKNPHLRLRRHRIRRVGHARRRGVMATADEWYADGCGARPRRASERQRSHRRHARPRTVRAGRHHAAAAVDADRRRPPRRTCSPSGRPPSGSIRAGAASSATTRGPAPTRRPSVPPGRRWTGRRIVNTPIITWYFDRPSRSLGHADHSERRREAVANSERARPAGHHPFRRGTGGSIRPPGRPRRSGLQANPRSWRRSDPPRAFRLVRASAGLSLTAGGTRVEGVLQIRERSPGDSAFPAETEAVGTSCDVRRNREEQIRHSNCRDRRSRRRARL